MSDIFKIYRSEQYMKKILILGSTGSIGRQTLQVIDFLSEKWEVTALTANTNIDLLEKQARYYNVKFAVIKDKELAYKLKKRLRNTDIEVKTGLKSLEYVAGLSDIDLIVNAIVGAAGLKPSIAALKAGNLLGLANKESMVMGGSIINEILGKNKGKILPIDSEHNAIFQIIEDHEQKEIKKILLTASGGPFLNLSSEKLEQVTVAQALNHPNWDMGNKITIDSATMMNKGLEVIEAHWLFKQSYDKIKVVVHPQSIIHSMVEFKDNAIMAEMGVSDMRLAIQNVITYPKRYASPVKTLDLFSVGQLNFVRPDFNKFPALRLAYQAGKEGGSFPAVLNAANEVAVQKFLKKEISYLQITQLIEKVMHKHKNINEPQPSELFAVDRWSRKVAREVAECL